MTTQKSPATWIPPESIPVTLDIAFQRPIDKHVYFTYCEDIDLSSKNVLSDTLAQYHPATPYRAGMTLNMPKTLLVDAFGSQQHECIEETWCTLLNYVGIRPGNFENHALGAYDPIVNRVNPMNMGIVFPDGCVRCIWDHEDHPIELEQTVDYVRQSLAFLQSISTLPCIRETDEHVNTGDSGALQRRIDYLLDKAGYTIGSTPDPDLGLAVWTHYAALPEDALDHLDGTDSVLKPD